MSLKRRNIIACILLVVAAFCWTYSQQILQGNIGAGVDSTMPSSTYVHTTQVTTYPTQETVYPPPTAVPGSEPASESTSEPATEPAEQLPSSTNQENNQFWGFVLCIGSAVMVVIAVFVLRQKSHMLGIDVISAVVGFGGIIELTIANIEYIVWNSVLSFWQTGVKIAVLFTVFFALRELWGWLLAKCPLSWCLVSRFAKRCATPQMSLSVYIGWIVAALVCTLFFLFEYDVWLPVISFGLVALLGGICLWKYGADLTHFQEQLNNYQKGLPITVKDGAFSQTEAQLVEVQTQHEEAVKTAVTSERFKVELISNVSHDLRTPLTAILGYSELLQQETLSQEGQEQLNRLNQKAGYMSDLVDSLFELTKVSSGVVESKKEKIDLIRLSEQTIGLFDDQLTNAGLIVKRDYESNAMLVVTDGSRMHQVFANLLGNAIKYALPGTRIYLETKETVHSYRIRMMNTASYEMDFKTEEIMQRFARGDKARSTKGSGLGLAIAQTYTESVGGTFRIAVDGDQFSAIVELPKTERNL